MVALRRVCGGALRRAGSNEVPRAMKSCIKMYQRCPTIANSRDGGSSSGMHSAVPRQAAPGFLQKPVLDCILRESALAAEDRLGNRCERLCRRCHII